MVGNSSKCKYKGSLHWENRPIKPTQRKEMGHREFHRPRDLVKELTVQSKLQQRNIKRIK